MLFRSIVERGVGIRRRNGEKLYVFGNIGEVSLMFRADRPY